MTKPMTMTSDHNYDDAKDANEELASAIMMILTDQDNVDYDMRTNHYLQEIKIIKENYDDDETIMMKVPSICQYE